MKFSNGEKILIMISLVTLLVNLYDIFILKEKLYEEKVIV